MTSHDVVGRCRRIFATRRVGHAGTLDPMATGALVVEIEPATKILGLLTATFKAYAATIRLGQSTSTEDAEGVLLQSVPADHVTDQAIEAALGPLRGDIRQIPSAVSAIKVARRRAYPLMFARCDLTAEEAGAAGNGRALSPAGIDGIYAATAPDGRVIALMRGQGRRTESVVVIRPSTL